MHHCPSIVVIVGLLIAPAASSTAWEAPLSEDVPSPLVQLNGAGLSVQAAGAPLDRVLSRIAEVYGASIVLAGQLAIPVFVDFRDYTLAEAITRLVGGAAFVILHHANPGTDDPGPPSEIRIYASADGVPANVLAPTASYDGPVDALEETSTADAPTEELDKPEPTRTEIEAMADRRTAEDLESLGQVVEGHSNAEMRHLALALLGDIPDDRAVRSIERGLGDADPLFRSVVVETLSRVDAPDAVRSLGYVVFAERDSAVRLQAVFSLTERHEEPAWAFLGAAAGDIDPSIRRAARRALRAKNR